MKEVLKPYWDLEEVFTGNSFELIDLGELNVTSNQLICCDPFVSLVHEEGEPFIEKVALGKYSVTLSVYKDKESCRNMGVRLNLSSKKAEYYELALTKNMNIDELDREKEEYFGFFVDAGMACITDMEGARLAVEFTKKLEKEDEGFGDVYNDYFFDLLEESARKYPEYQRKYGDFLNWTIPGTDKNVIIFTSGYGDGVYPCYWGYDKEQEICSLIINFIEPNEFLE